MTENRSAPEVHVAGVLWRYGIEGPEVLFCKRGNDRQLFPGLWEGFGGRVYIGETFEMALARHAENDLRIAVKPSDICLPYSFMIDGRSIPGVRMLCSAVVEPPNTRDLERFRWVPLHELKQARDDSAFISGLVMQVVKLMGLRFQ